jgi:hypothetical protein
MLKRFGALLWISLVAVAFGLGRWTSSVSVVIQLGKPAVAATVETAPKPRDREQELLDREQAARDEVKTAMAAWRKSLGTHKQPGNDHTEER